MDLTYDVIPTGGRNLNHVIPTGGRNLNRIIIYLEHSKGADLNKFQILSFEC